MISNFISFLLPKFGFRPADTNNASQIWFSWMFFHVWSMDSFCFGADLDVSFSRVGFGVIFPYLRIWVGTNHFFYEPLANLERALRRTSDQGNTETDNTTFV